MTATFCNFKQAKTAYIIDYLFRNIFNLTGKGSNKHKGKMYELVYVDQLNNVAI